MSVSSPKFINPWRFAGVGTVVEGQVSVSGMTRLATLLRNDSGSATYEFSFVLDDQNLPLVTGHVTAVVEVICQRCLEPMPLTLSSAVRVGIIGPAEAESSAELETVIVEDHQLSLAALVEEELILALPTAPLHASGDCRPPSYVGAVDTNLGASAEGAFADLGKQKSGNGKPGP